ncbi:MAG TPA: adenylyl-sulfate kinase, partial [Steroidobacteraceae bacterium]|nr:adenylyl-sulfate kinase [Steroidobacteraceae bacterium]
TAELAIILVDAQKGVLTQTRRHSYLVSLLGIRRIVLAVNKMDLVGYSAEVFTGVERAYRQFAAQIGLPDVVAIPLSALRGENVVASAASMPWYHGPALLAHLEQVPLGQPDAEEAFRLPVQRVNRPNPEFRGFSGLIASGTVRVGERLRVLPSGLASRVQRIVTADGDLALAVAGQSVTLTLEDEIDVSRGDLMTAGDAPALLGDRCTATLVWMGEEPMLPGRRYLLKCGTRTLSAAVSALQYRIDVNTLAHQSAARLELNEIGAVVLSLDQPLAFDPYTRNRDTGGFILIDRVSNQTVGAGLLQSALHHDAELHWQTLDVDRNARAAQKHQKPCVLWFTGLSGAGKSTIANLVEKKLFASGCHTYLLDGDNVRHGLNSDLGYADEDRVENIRRVAEVAKLMFDAGLIVLVSFISPFRAERELARSLFAPGEFLEIFVDTALEEAERRDPKGLYRKARAGQLRNFTGIDSPYEAPENPELRIDTRGASAEQSADTIILHMRRAGVIDRDWVFIP